MVRREGGSRVVSISHIIPAEWVAVDMRITKTTKTAIVVKIERVK
jgi:hypothetical protein